MGYCGGKALTLSVAAALEPRPDDALRSDQPLRQRRSLLGLRGARLRIWSVGLGSRAVGVGERGEGVDALAAGGGGVDHHAVAVQALHPLRPGQPPRLL